MQVELLYLMSGINTPSPATLDRKETNDNHMNFLGNLVTLGSSLRILRTSSWINDFSVAVL